MKKNILLNPGPATTSYSVKKSMVVPDICPRENEFVRLMEEIREGLKKVVNADKNYTCILFAGSGTAAIDAVINSVVPSNKKIMIINNGAYGERMIKIARAYKIDYEELAFAWDELPDPGSIQDILRKDKKITHVAMVHHETTTGMLNPLKEVGGIVSKFGRSFIVDTVSSFAGIPIDIKKGNIDFMMSTSNKCIQGMAGISFVICKKEGVEKTSVFHPRSFYLDLYQQYKYFQGHGEMQFTPPVQIAYALRQAIKEYFAEGGEDRHGRYLKNWTVLTEGLKKIGFKLLLKDEMQSHILTTIIEPSDKNYNFKKMHDNLYRKGFTIYPGKIGKKGTFRLANMGDINSRDIKKFLAALEDTLIEMGVVL